MAKEFEEFWKEYCVKNKLDKGYFHDYSRKIAFDIWITLKGMK
jgi:hypothetical protein